MGNCISIEFDFGENNQNQDAENPITKKRINPQKITDTLAEDPLLEDMCEKAGIEADGGKFWWINQTSIFSEFDGQDEEKSPQRAQ